MAVPSYNEVVVTIAGQRYLISGDLIVEAETKMKIIGITGKAGSGKSTVAACLMAELRNRFYPARRLAFADPLKSICRQMGWNGVKDKRGRRLLQIIGTEAGRECIGQDVES